MHEYVRYVLCGCWKLPNQRGKTYKVDASWKRDRNWANGQALIASRAQDDQVNHISWQPSQGLWIIPVATRTAHQTEWEGFSQKSYSYPRLQDFKFSKFLICLLSVQAGHLHKSVISVTSEWSKTAENEPTLVYHTAALMLYYGCGFSMWTASNGT